MLFFIISVFDRLSERVMNCFSIWEAGKMREGSLPSPSLQCVAPLSRLEHGVSVQKNDIQIISNGQPLSIHPHEETSESLINFWIINSWPLFGKSWEMLMGSFFFSHWIHSNTFLQSNEHSFWVSDFYFYWTRKRVLKPTVGNEWEYRVW